MANIIATGMISMHDLTDAYVVTLSNYSYTFTGDTTGVPVGKSCSVVINATQGVDACSNVSVVQDKIVCPTGITAAVSGNGTSEVTITFTTNAKLTADCEAKIPITITPTKGDAVVINKKFAFAVAKTGQPGAKGETGEKGEKGATGNAGADAWNITVITINGSTDTFHNNKGTAVAEAIVHKGVTLMTVGDDGKVGSYGFVNWYTSTDVDAVPVGTGRTLTITADMVDGDTPYYARLES